MKKPIILLLCLTFAMGPLLSHPLSAMADCPTFMESVQLGTVESSLLVEISGVAASRKNADVLWVHNDSGDSARIYALSIQGRHLGVYNLVGANATDWEDIAIGPGPAQGQDYIYVGDVGDNARSRSSVTVYRVAEPSVSASQDPVTVNLDDVDALPMQYPGPAVFDCEALLVDPVSGDIFLVTKDRAGEGVAHVFRNPAPHIAGVMVTLELVDDIPLPSQVTGGDVSPSGDGILLRLYHQAYYWHRATGINLWEASSGTACPVPLAVEPQGEAIAFAADGLGYYTVSEGAFQPVYFYEIEEPTPINLTKGPYLQSVTPNSIIVVWETDAPGNSAVEYGLTNAYGLEATDATSTTHHAVTIEGLSPYTTYHYRVQTNGNVLNDDSTFKTAADQTQGTFSFAVYGDNRSDHAAHQSVVNRALTLAPDFVLDTGDLVADGTVAEQWDTFFDIERELLKIAPFFSSLGNHERNSAHYFNLFHLPNNERYYSFDYGNAHIVALEVDGYQSYSAGSAQYNWLANDLASTSQPWKLVFFHFPPYSSGSHGDDPTAQRDLVPLFEQYGVQIVFNGHDHDYERSLVNGVNYIVAGGGGAPLYSVTGGPYTVYAESTLHVVSVSINEHTLTSVGVRPDGTTFDGFTMTCTPLSRDLDCDCGVDVADIMLVTSRWHSSLGDDDYDPAYDLNDDGKIDIVDIMLVAVHWGETC